MFVGVQMLVQYLVTRISVTKSNIGAIYNPLNKSFKKFNHPNQFYL